MCYYRRKQFGGNLARMRKKAHTGLWWEKREGKRPLRKTRRRWEDNIKMDFQE